MPSEDASNTKVLCTLEDFFCSPSFTSALGQWMSENASRLEFVEPEREQPLQNHALYVQYQEIVEQQLSRFLKEQGVTQEALFHACQDAKSSGQASSMICIDYLLACTEYEEFMQLAYDHVQLMQYDPEEGAADDCELPPASDDEVVGAAAQAVQ